MAVHVCVSLCYTLLQLLIQKFQRAQVSQGPEKPVLAVLTDKDLLLYPSCPESKESLNNPTKSHPLITTRFPPLQHTLHNMTLVLSLSFLYQRIHITTEFQKPHPVRLRPSSGLI